MAQNWASTPTQYEIDLARLGVNTDTHEWDGSPVDTQSRDPTQPPGGPGDVSPLPAITSISPTSWPVPDVDLVVVGTDFGSNPLVVFNGSALKTRVALATELHASVQRFDGKPGPYKVLVRNSVGDSNVKTFNFVPPV